MKKDQLNRIWRKYMQWWVKHIDLRKYIFYYFIFIRIILYITKMNKRTTIRLRNKIEDLKQSWNGILFNLCTNMRLNKENDMNGKMSK